MPYRLLLVPGENEALRALPGQLDADVETQVLETANDALWEVRGSPPEAIVADVQLPGMSGLELAEIVPNFGVPTRVVLWSREPDARAEREAASYGVYRFLNGPVALDQLREAIYDALGKSAAALEPRADLLASPVIAPPVVAAPPPSVEQPHAQPDRVGASIPNAASTPVAPPPPSAEQPRARPERPAPPAAGSSRLSERLRERPAPAAPRERPAPEPPPRRSSSRRREGPLVLTAEALTPIRNRLDSLMQDFGAQCILLTDRAGMVLVEIGHTTGLPTIALLPMLSTSFSTASQIADILREEEATALYMHEGTRYDLYCFDVMQRFMLVLVFDKSGPATKIGSVWVYAKRAIREMEDLLG